MKEKLCFFLISLMFYATGVPAQNGKSEKTDNEFAKLLQKATAGDVSAQSTVAYCYSIGDGVEKNAEKAFYWNSKAALAGDALAMGEIGLSYLQGRGVEADFDKGLEWSIKAAEKEATPVQMELAECYYFGKEYPSGKFPKDNEKAVYWFKKVAAQESQVDESVFYSTIRANAMAYLGVCYQYGDGVEPDAQIAFEWYRKAAESGNAFAQYMMGEYYHEGTDGVVEPDAQTAFEWYKKAAENGNAFAQSMMGEYYHEGTDGMVEPDAQTAFEWYRKAAENGNAFAQYWLARCYEDGDGVSVDYKKSVYWYKKTIQNPGTLKEGMALSMYSLALCYEKGKGVERDEQKALEYLSKAAESDCDNAQFDLGMAYYNGKFGLPKDYQQAVKWFHKAAEQGNADAQNNLGVFYYYGEGVKKKSQGGKTSFTISGSTRS